MDGTFLFSVVVPIYNVEKYLRKTIESVVRQSVGFKRHIQLILVNDGSTDGSGAVCLEYARRFPDNVLYIRKENGGVSSARNEAFPHIRGRYVNFLDADDLWSAGAFEKARRFFEAHGGEVDVLAARVRFCEARNDWHPLDFRFAGDRVVDIASEPESIQLHCSSAWIRAEALAGVSFDTRLSFGEDARFVNEIILKKGKYGAAGSIIYFYRKRLDNSSALQTCMQQPTYYADTPKHFLGFLQEAGAGAAGGGAEYVEHIVLYDLCSRMTERIPGSLPRGVAEGYFSELRALLGSVSDSAVCASRFVPCAYRVPLLAFKCGADIRESLALSGGRVFFRSCPALDPAREKLVAIHTVRLSGGHAVVEGYHFIPTAARPHRLVAVLQSGVTVENERSGRIEVPGMLFAGGRLSAETFRFDIALSGETGVRFLLEYGNGRIPCDFTCGKFVGLADWYARPFYVDSGYLVTRSGAELRISRASGLAAFRREAANQVQLLASRKWKVSALRIAARLYRLALGRRELWLISDRMASADDNGYHFFRFVRARKPKGVTARFLINRSCPDERKVKKAGCALHYSTLRYWLAFLACDKVISSQASDYVTNPFGNYREYLKDLYRFDFVFLQHGIIKDDLSDWLNAYSKNIAIFVTSTRPEYESILGCDYHYDGTVVKLTGLPRYDELSACPGQSKKQILVAPTWRKNLAGRADNRTAIPVHSDEFRESEYFRFYQALMNDGALLECMRKNGYTGKFVIHPVLISQIVDFTGNDVFAIVDNVDYQREFRENALMVTDYSSTAFDFAYLGKPVIYAQFDRDTFFQGHSYTEGYFDYERDGFGEVESDLRGTVGRIVEYIGRDCRPKPEYAARVERTFMFRGAGNCERVFDSICALPKRRKLKETAAGAPDEKPGSAVGAG